MNEKMNIAPDDKTPLVRLLALFIISAVTISFTFKITSSPSSFRFIKTLALR